jgi:acyl-CoA synthetase (AMP-forming)/AMP-acid ligase II
MKQAHMRVLADVVRHHAATYGDKPAFVGPAGALGFAAVNERMNRLTHALAALGLAKGDRVAILSHNRPEYFEVYGVAKSGLVAVPLNWRLSARELLQTLADSGPSVLVAEPGFTALVDELRPQLGGIRSFVVFGDAAPGWAS